MALCLANSLVVKSGFHPYDQLVRYKWWYRNGYMSSTGQCFDIGAATSQSLIEFERRQLLFIKKHKVPQEEIDNLSDQSLLQEFNVYCSDNEVAGNGALMRLAPVPLFFFRSPEYAVEYSGRSGQITHGDTKAYDACRYYGALIVAALQGYEKDQLLDKQFYSKHQRWFLGQPLCTEIKLIAEGSYQKKGGYKDGIRGKGYIVNALEAALWAFWSDENSFETGALAAVNLGDDTDTTAAIYGQLAGAYYGYKNLPKKWLDHVYAKKFMLNLSKWITYEGQKWQPTEAIYPFNPSSPSQLQIGGTNTGSSGHQPNFYMHSSPNESFVPGNNSSVHNETSPRRANLRTNQLEASTGQPTEASISNTYLGPNNRSKMNSQFTHQLQPDEMVPEVPVNKPRSNLNLPPNNEPVSLINTFVNSGQTTEAQDEHRSVLRKTISVPPMYEPASSSAMTNNQRPAGQYYLTSTSGSEKRYDEKNTKPPKTGPTPSEGPPQLTMPIPFSDGSLYHDMKPPKFNPFQQGTSTQEKFSTQKPKLVSSPPTTSSSSGKQAAGHTYQLRQPKTGADNAPCYTASQNKNPSSNSPNTSSTEYPPRNHTTNNTDQPKSTATKSKGSRSLKKLFSNKDPTN
jgi:ADP-ribosyl-[dinitrogen reductase] hydrolase